MLLKATEVDIELMKMLQEDSERSTLCHLSEGINILGEALAAITELTIGTRNIGVCIIDAVTEDRFMSLEALILITSE